MNNKKTMNGPELLKAVMIRTLKEKAEQEDKLADMEIKLMNECDNSLAFQGVGARKHSDQAKIHRYAAKEFRKLAKMMEDK